jgi:Icc-related predicted phosphoesterase
MSRCIALGLVVGMTMAGCGRSSEPDTGTADNQKFLRCAEPHDDGKQEQFHLPPLTVERKGLTAVIHGIKRGLVVLGVIADITEPSAANFKNIDFFLEQFRDAGAQALLFPGGVGLTEQDMDAVLERLARAPVPILLTPGAQENFDVFRRVIERKRKKYPQLLDMTRVRRVHLGHITIVSLPGYYRPFYLSAQERGCGYQVEDVQLTASLFEKRRPTVLLSPPPPRGSGAGAVDRGRGGINIGDPALQEILAAEKCHFGVFGHVPESGGNATLADGKTPVAPGIWYPSLYIQAGSAESLPVSLVGEGRSTGMAQIVEISAARGRFRTLTAPHFPGRQ